MPSVTVREYARLTTEQGHASLDVATIAPSAFRWLANQRESSDAPVGKVVQIEGLNSLRLNNFVGVLETPCGTQIEILPKYVDGEEDALTARKLLVDMIIVATRTQPRPVGVAQVEAFKLPLTEWLFEQFLLETADLLKRGLRQGYSRIQGCERFLKGRLLAQKQIGGGAARAHIFNIEYDLFTFDRAENRLIRAALDQVLHSTRTSENWRLARELSLVMAEIPPSADIRRFQTMGARSIAGALRFYSALV